MKISLHLSGMTATAVVLGSSWAIAADLPVKAVAPPPELSAWETQIGARWWYSSGKVQKDLFGTNNTPGVSLAVSRLIYDNLTGHSGELFGRVDHTTGLFFKFNAGLGSMGSHGKLNDEDFDPSAMGGSGYSNTLSTLRDGNLSYATADVGYSFVTAPGAKLGAFVGYNHFFTQENAYDCVQQAANQFVNGCGVNTRAITESNHWQSLRVGLSGEFAVSERLKLSVDAAYLPYVSFRGVDDHVLRSLRIDEIGDNGNGAQIESVLSYAVTDGWSLGLGGRYWTFKSNDTSARFQQLPRAPDASTQRTTFTAERYGMFLQSSYKWGDTTPPSAAVGFATKAPPLAVNWTGVYVGGQLGAGFGPKHWSDSIGSTTSLVNPGSDFPAGTPPGLNVGGFGKSTPMAGGLGGAQLGYNFQTGRTVLGVEADVAFADLKGSHTIYSGLGGGQAEAHTTALGSVTGRVGYAVERNLLYVKAGGAWAVTDHTLDTSSIFIPSQGEGCCHDNVRSTRLGWTVGAGLEYAVDRHWSAKLEYDYMDFGSQSVSFPVNARLGLPSVDIDQAFHVVKMGVNYKLDWGVVASN
ncbi:outer membrane beta-barrel protein [Rhodopseudomonas palustris]|uniref:Outer membrane protein beta-barrel domain-containing protein n=1 Tax=Rhodopseudomonas palustris (strain BisB18) TaxID=316056 RepID=Q213V0_RHOPB